MNSKCMFSKCNIKCNKPQSCNCQNKCSMNEIYMFLGKYTFDLLCEAQLPCGHPGLRESLCRLIDGKPLPCGHPTLDEILLKVLEKDTGYKCCQCYKCYKN